MRYYNLDGVAPDLYPRDVLSGLSQGHLRVFRYASHAIENKLFDLLRWNTRERAGLLRSMLQQGLAHVITGTAGHRAS